MKTFFYNKLNAGNDINGNPRICYDVWENNGAYAGAVDDNHAGNGAMWEAFGQHNFILLGHYDVKVKQYKERLKAGAEWMKEKEERG